ncbi:MAG: hypothetical protein PHU43_08875 [Candidatus Bipolaricaulis sp.]|nr:hypothetical protein [Candidatus Bipolaricaulis sp.]
MTEPVTPSAVAEPAVPSAQPAESADAPRGVVSAVPGATPASEPQAAGAANDLLAQSPNALEALTSYRYVTVLSFTGKLEGKLESGSIELRGAVAGPDREQVMWKDLATGEEFGVIRIGEEAWMLEGNEWQSVPKMVADMITAAILALGPAMSWGDLSQGVATSSTYMGTETVNGIPARHYSSSSKDWATTEWEGTLEAASNDFWIAEAGYPVRYVFTAKGVDTEGYKGSMLWSMELSDVNGPVTIEAPQGAKGLDE